MGIESIKNIEFSLDIDDKDIKDISEKMDNFVSSIIADLSQESDSKKKRKLDRLEKKFRRKSNRNLDKLKKNISMEDNVSSEAKEKKSKLQSNVEINKRDIKFLNELGISVKQDDRGLFMESTDGKYVFRWSDDMYDLGTKNRYVKNKTGYALNKISSFKLEKKADEYGRYKINILDKNGRLYSMYIYTSDLLSDKLQRASFDATIYGGTFESRFKNDEEFFNFLVENIEHYMRGNNIVERRNIKQTMINILSEKGYDANITLGTGYDKNGMGYFRIEGWRFNPKRSGTLHIYSEKMEESLAFSRSSIENAGNIPSVEDMQKWIDDLLKKYPQVTSKSFTEGFDSNKHMHRISYEGNNEENFIITHYPASRRTLASEFKIKNGYLWDTALPDHIITFEELQEAILNDVLEKKKD